MYVIVLIHFEFSGRAKTVSHHVLETCYILLLCFSLARIQAAWLTKGRKDLPIYVRVCIVLPYIKPWGEVQRRTRNGTLSHLTCTKGSLESLSANDRTTSSWFVLVNFICMLKIYVKTKHFTDISTTWQVDYVHHSKQLKPLCFPPLSHGHPPRWPYSWSKGVTNSCEGSQQKRSSLSGQFPFQKKNKNKENLKTFPSLTWKT